MLNRIIIYLSLGLCFSAKAQTVPSHCKADDKIVKLYKNDADRMAIRYVFHSGSSYKDSVKINRQLSSDYLNALLAVYNATTLPANDTITRFLNIHTYNPGLNSLVILADSNLFWMTNLKYDILPTRDYTIDNMMKLYDLKRVFYSGLMQPSMVVFKTETNSNLLPLTEKIKSLTGVKKAEAEYFYGDGNDIKDSINEKYTELIYSYGWEDCPNGCVKRRYWRFRVFSDCSVEYMGSYGNSLQAALTLSVVENHTSFEEVNIYPNPVKNKLYLERKDLKSKELSLEIINKKDEVVSSLKKINSKEEIDLILLSNGIYSLVLKDGNKKKIFKIIKE